MFWIVINSNNTDLAEFLLKNSSQFRSSLRRKSKPGNWSDLVYAAYYGSKEMISLLIEYGANLKEKFDMRGNLQSNILGFVCCEGKHEVLQHLIDAHAKEDKSSEVEYRSTTLDMSLGKHEFNSYTPLMFAANNGRI